MQPKTALIILAILAILGLSFIGYLYYYTQKITLPPLNIVNNKQNKEIKKELSPEEIKKREQERLNIIKNLSAKKATLTPGKIKSREKERLDIINKLNQEKAKQ